MAAPLGSPNFPPSLVLPYANAAPPPPYWMARSLCVLALAYGLVFCGSAVNSILDDYRGPTRPLLFIVATLSASVIVFSILGLLRMSASRWGLIISIMAVGLTVLCESWMSFQHVGLLYPRVVASLVLYIVHNMTIPVFVVIGLMRQPIRECFRRT